MIVAVKKVRQGHCPLGGQGDTIRGLCFRFEYEVWWDLTIPENMIENPQVFDFSCSATLYIHTNTCVRSRVCALRGWM